MVGSYCSFHNSQIVGLNVLTFLIGVCDILLGFGVLYSCYFPILYFADLRDIFGANDVLLEEDALWYGICILPIFGGIAILGGARRICWVIQTKGSDSSSIPFLCFFTLQLVAFTFPFIPVIIRQYARKIDLLVTFAPDFMVFKLLQVNWITGGLLIYELFGFWIIWKRNSIWGKKRDSDSEELYSGSYRNFNRCHSQSTTIIEEVEMEEFISTSVINISSVAPIIIPIKSVSPLQEGEQEETFTNNNPRYFTEEEGSGYDAIWKYDEEHATFDGSLKSSTTVIFENDHWTFRRHQEIKMTQFQLRKLKYVREHDNFLFEDPDFPADQSSIGFEFEGRGDGNVEWKRPHEIGKNAMFFNTGEHTNLEVKRGLFGNNGHSCFLTLLGSLTQHDALFSKVVPMDNEWSMPPNVLYLYCGMCHFWFNLNGAWEEVVVDDRLPTMNGKLIFIQSLDGNDFWCSLLEKAYAKFLGSYRSLYTTDIDGVMHNFTPGMVRKYSLDGWDECSLSELLRDAIKDKMAIFLSPRRENGTQKWNCEQCYSIMDTVCIKYPALSSLNVWQQRNAIEPFVPCIRIANPVGNHPAGNNPQNQNWHPLWSLIPEEDEPFKNKLQAMFLQDGRFWFPVKNMIKNFKCVELVSVQI